MARICRFAEDKQLVILSAGRRTLRNVICRISSQRKLVKKSFDGSRNGKEGWSIVFRLYSLGSWRHCVVGVKTNHNTVASNPRPRRVQGGLGNPPATNHVTSHVFARALHQVPATCEDLDLGHSFLSVLPPPLFLHPNLHPATWIHFYKSCRVVVIDDLDPRSVPPERSSAAF